MRLINVDKNNWKKVIFLTTDPEGKHFLGEEYVASNAYSLLQAVYEEGWTVKAIEHEGVLIGFTMYGWSEEENFYELCRFMIDRRYQGKGYGKEALDVIVSEMKKEFSCNEIYLSTEPENVRAKHIYEKAGFVSTGKIVDEEELFKMEF